MPSIGQFCVLNYRTAYQSWKDEIDSVKKERPAAANTQHHRRSTTPNGVDSGLWLVEAISESDCSRLQNQNAIVGRIHALLLVIQAIVVSGSMGDVTGFKGSLPGSSCSSPPSLIRPVSASG